MTEPRFMQQIHATTNAVYDKFDLPDWREICDREDAEQAEYIRLHPKSGRGDWIAAGILVICTLALFGAVAWCAWRIL